jgi:hypothetical protein
MLSDSEKVDIRRFCGFPVCGTARSSTVPATYFQSYGTLEFRMANLSVSEIAVVRRYLNSLTSLEIAIPAAAENLDTDEASVWSRNKSEVDDRIRLFDEWRRRLCGFLGVVAGPAFRNNNFSLIV